jgi:ABC-type lipoprotein release transport system permease subunit
LILLAPVNPHMSRRRGRRRSGGSTYAIVALLVAIGVVAGIVALIMRGDTTPRTARAIPQTVAQSPHAPVIRQPTSEPAAVPSPPSSSSVQQRQR